MKIYFHLSCVAGRDLYPAPQIADDLFGIFIIDEYLVIFIVSPRNVSIDALVISALAGQCVHDLLVC